MSAIPLIVRRTQHLIIEATLNGARKVDVRVLERGANDTPDKPEAGKLVAPPTSVDLAVDVSRQRYLQGLSKQARTEIAPVLNDLTNDVHEVRQQAAAADRGESSAARASRWEAIEPSQEPQNGATLLADIEHVLTRHVILPPGAGALCAIWVLHTHCIEAADYSPYLWIRSPTAECGKSTLIDWLAVLAHHPVGTANASPAVLYHLIEKHSCTLLLDDIDTAFVGERRFDIANILNAGFHRGSPVYRMEKSPNGQMFERAYETFGAKVVGGIGRNVLSDATASRTIRIDLKRASGDKLRALPRPRDGDRKDIGSQFRARIARWRKDNLTRLKERRPLIPHSLAGRLADMADPLLSIADVAGGNWPERARQLIPAFTGRATDEPDQKVRLLRDLARLFKKREADFLLTGRIIDALNGLQESPWAEFNHGRGLTSAKLAEMLRDFDIKSKQKRSEGSRRGYFRKPILAAVRLYASRKAATSATTATSQPIPLVDKGLDGSGTVADASPTALTPSSSNGSVEPRKSKPTSLNAMRNTAVADVATVASKNRANTADAARPACSNLTSPLNRKGPRPKPRRVVHIDADAGSGEHDDRDGVAADGGSDSQARSNDPSESETVIEVLLRSMVQNGNRAAS